VRWGHGDFGVLPDLQAPRAHRAFRVSKDLRERSALKVRRVLKVLLDLQALQVHKAIRVSKDLQE